MYQLRPHLFPRRPVYLWYSIRVPQIKIFPGAPSAKIQLRLASHAAVSEQVSSIPPPPSSLKSTSPLPAQDHHTSRARASSRLRLTSYIALQEQASNAHPASAACTSPSTKHLAHSTPAHHHRLHDHTLSRHTSHKLSTPAVGLNVLIFVGH